MRSRNPERDMKKSSVPTPPMSMIRGISLPSIRIPLRMNIQ